MSFYCLGLLWRLLYGKKHRYTQSGTETAFASVGVAWPVHRCNGCENLIHLDKWQVATLPVLMAYGCKV